MLCLTPATRDGAMVPATAPDVLPVAIAVCRTPEQHRWSTLSNFPAMRSLRTSTFSRASVRASPVGLLVIDVHGRLRFANHRATQILGVSAEVLLQHTGDAGLAWRVCDTHGHPVMPELTEGQQVVQTGQAQYDIQCGGGPPGRDMCVAHHERRPAPHPAGRYRWGGHRG